jgi:ribose transport system substrate-binding protein
MRHVQWAIVMAVCVALAVVGCSGGPDEKSKPAAPSGTAGAGAKVLKLAVIPKGTTHVFWKSVHAGAAKAAEELGLTVDWQGPIVEDDRESQVRLVETFIQKHVDGIVMAPLDDKALIAPVMAAGKAGIPVVIIDSNLADPNAYVSFVATDNYSGGAMGARRLAEALGDAGGKVILLRYQVGSASTENREKGFLDEMAKHPKIQVISSNQYAGPTVETALANSQALLTKFGEGKVDGIFCPNESSTSGMLRALDTSGRAGKVKFVGFDSSPELIEALKKGQLSGLVVQNPYKMGYEGVKTMADHLRGRKVEKLVDTGVVVVTPENLTQPDVDRLVHPPLE